MANTDEHGNKIAVKKEKASIVSQRIRDRRVTTPGNLRNPKICGVCGYRIRREKHTGGRHHNVLSLSGHAHVSSNATVNLIESKR